MSFVGKWAFYSAGVMGDDEMVFYVGEELLKAPMPYVDESDPEAVEDELRERKTTLGMQIAVQEDGLLYLLMPLPEGVSQAEVDEAVKAGQIKLYDGMMTDDPKKWEERDGVLYVDWGMGEEMSQASDEQGDLMFITYRFKKIEK